MNISMNVFFFNFNALMLTNVTTLKQSNTHKL